MVTCYEPQCSFPLPLFKPLWWVYSVLILGHSTTRMFRLHGYLPLVLPCCHPNYWLLLQISVPSKEFPFFFSLSLSFMVSFLCRHCHPYCSSVIDSTHDRTCLSEFLGLKLRMFRCFSSTYFNSNMCFLSCMQTFLILSM